MRLQIRDDHRDGAAAHIRIDGQIREDVTAVTVRIRQDGLTEADVTFTVDELDLDIVAGAIPAQRTGGLPVQDLIKVLKQRLAVHDGPLS